MQHSTSWLNCSKAYRRGLLSVAARGPTEAEARAAKVQREAERRRAQAAGVSAVSQEAEP